MRFEVAEKDLGFQTRIWVDYIRAQSGIQGNQTQYLKVDIS